MFECPSPVIEAVQSRTQEIVDALHSLSDGDLSAPSGLQDWSRLTIAARLRYGARAMLRMTEGALTTQPVAFYLRAASASVPTRFVLMRANDRTTLSSRWRGAARNSTPRGDRSDRSDGAFR